MLLTSATVSRLADGAASIALVLVVIARTHDARLAGLVVAAFTVPTLVSGPVLGAYLDRLRARHLLFAANQLMLAGTLTGVVVLAGHTPALVLAGLGLCAGLTAPVLTGGFSSLIPLVVPPASLPRANALDAASYNVAGLAGPAIVAAVAGAAGPAAALTAIAAVAAAGLVLVLAAPMPAAPSRLRASTLRAALHDGLRLLWHRPLLRATTISTTLSQFAQGLLPVTLPLLAVQLGRTTAAGAWLLTAISCGGLAGALASHRLLARWTPRTILLTATAGFGACLAALAAMPDLVLALGLAVLAGLAEGPTLAATLTVRQQNVPAEHYAQISATAASIKTGSYALGAAATGLLAGTLTGRQLMLAIAVGQAIAITPLLLPLPPLALLAGPAEGSLRECSGLPAPAKGRPRQCLCLAGPPAYAPAPRARRRWWRANPLNVTFKGTHALGCDIHGVGAG
jgi:MFS family permease